MFLGIEIGGAKLQLGVGAAQDRTLLAIERASIDPQHGATGILNQIETIGSALLARFAVRRIGIGFGGPVDVARGLTLKSHQVDGWNDFPLVDWCRRAFDKPITLGNDCDCAGLAEARLGAGRDQRVMFYVTVGSGIGGGLILDGQVYRGNGVAAGEIGHLRPGLHADRPDETVESLASGWGIAAAAQARLADPISHPLKSLQGGKRALKPDDVRQRLIDLEEADEEYAADLRERCSGRVEQLTAKHVAQAAADGNEMARDVIAHACQALGWGIAQTITLLAPQVVVIGGGVAQADEALFLNPLRQQIDRYLFPPLLHTCKILPAALGEDVVVHGALQIAAMP